MGGETNHSFPQPVAFRRGNLGSCPGPGHVVGTGEPGEAIIDLREMDVAAERPALTGLEQAPQRFLGRRQEQFSGHLVTAMDRKRQSGGGGDLVGTVPRPGGSPDRQSQANLNRYRGNDMELGCQQPRRLQLLPHLLTKAVRVGTGLRHNDDADIRRLVCCVLFI